LAEGANFDPEPFDPEGADLVWLCNPNNPTGRLWPPGELSAWVRSHPRTLFAVDEAFLPLSFAASPEARSMARQVRDLSNLVVVRSLTKYYALPGLRLGYAVASPEWAARLREQAVPWSVNAPAQVGGRAALADEGYRARTHDWLQSEALTLAERIGRASHRCRPVPSETSF